MKLLELFATVGLDITGFETGANEAYKKADEIGTTIGTIIGNGINFALGFANVAKKTAELAKGASDVTGHIDDMAQTFGISTKAYQEWDYVFSQSGLDIDRFSSAFANLKKVMGGFGTEPQAEALDAIGLSIEKLSQMNVEDAFQTVITHLQGVENEAARSAAAVTLFGGSASSLPLLLNQGQEKIEELKSEAHDLGLVLSDTDISIGADMGDEVDKYTKSIEGMKTQLGVQFLPVFTEFLASLNEAAQTAMPAFQTVIEELSPVLSQLIDGGLDLVTNAITWIAENGEGAANALIAIGTGFYIVQWAINPIGTAIYTIMGLSLLLISNWEEIKNTAIGIWNSITGAIDSAIISLQKFLGINSGSGTHVSESGVSYGGGAGRPFASGIGYVPFDDFPSFLHRGEAVLTRQEAEDWRRGQNGGGVSASDLAAAVRNQLEGMAVLMDGVPVGRLVADTVSREIARKAR